MSGSILRGAAIPQTLQRHLHQKTLALTTLSSQFSVYLAAITDFDNQHQQDCICDLVYDSIITDPHSIQSIASFQHLHSRRPRVPGQRLDLRGQPSLLGAGELSKLAFGRGLELDDIGHWLESQVCLDLLPRNGAWFFEGLPSGSEINLIFQLLEQE